MGSFVCVSVVLEYHNLNPIISLDDAVDNSTKTSTTEEAVTSSKMNLHAAGTEPSARENTKNEFLGFKENWTIYL